MSLAATTSTTLSLIDGLSLKPHASIQDVERLPLLTSPKAHVWSPDNNALYITSSYIIQSFSPASSAFVQLYKSPQGSPLQPVTVCKDQSTLIFAQGSTIHFLAVGSSSPKITNSLTGHPASVVSLSLSNDASLLASTSALGTIHVHNLAHNSHTVMRGFPSGTGASSKHFACAFHPHTRTRLLVGSGKTIVVYDTTRPSAPAKSIPLVDKENNSNGSSVGYVVAISCSPFSKSLVAVACNSGFVAIVDLDKETALSKTFHMNVPITSMVFTPDSVSIAVGTENGKVLVRDLRMGGKDHRTILVGEEGKGECVIGLSIQTRVKTSPPMPSMATAKSTTATARLPTSLSAPLSQQNLNNAIASVKSPARRAVSSSLSPKRRGDPVTPVRSRAKKEEPLKRAFSPPRAPARGDDVANVSVPFETLMGGDTKAEEKAKVPKASVEKEKPNAAKPRLSASRTTASSALSPASGRVGVRLASGMTVADHPSSRPILDSRSGSRKPQIAGSTPPARESTNSKTKTSLETLTAGRPRTRTISRSNDVPSLPKSRPEPAASNLVHDLASSTIPPAPTASTSLNNLDQACRENGASTIRTTRTPTPDLPSVEDEESPLWKNKVQSLRARTGTAGILSTPEMDRWVEAGQGKQRAASEATAQARSKRVGWADSDGNDSAPGEGTENAAEIEDKAPPVSAAIDEGRSPAYIGPAPSAASNKEMSPIRRSHFPPGALQLSPLRASPLRGNAGGGGNGAQELLRAMVKDVMYEYRQETREDIKGLHLDLLRMGRSWKTELRSLMDEYVGDLRELREENARLRTDNERLRRGF